MSQKKNGIFSITEASRGTGGTELGTGKKSDKERLGRREKGWKKEKRQMRDTFQLSTSRLPVQRRRGDLEDEWGGGKTS